MPKTKISEFSSTPANNTDIDSINIAENCPPSGINDAIRELMAQLKDWQSGTSNDPYVVGSSGSLTLNQGTANGVAYLNGSKVVTSGTALSFDGSNLGLGVTPSAWVTLKGLEIAGLGNSISGYPADAGIYVSSNAYYGSGGWKYAYSSKAATLYSGEGGLHNWKIAPSGTAGNAITFTQAMTLDASGNLGIGTSSPATRLHVAGSTGLTLGAVSGDAWRTAAIVPIDEGSAYRGSLAFYTHPSAGSAGAPTERARIDSSGNLLVGTTTSNDKITVSTGSSAAISIGNGTNYTRIGRAQNNGDYQNNTTAGDAVLIGQNGVSIAGGAGGATAGVRLSSGATSWASLSDERLKTGLVSFQNPLQSVCSLRTGTGRYLTDASTISRSFLIAQDVQAVLPEAVDVQNDEQNTLGLRYQDLIPLLTAAIQELKAEFDAYKATHP